MGGGLNGEFDNYFPVETAQKPLYRMLGTPAADKKMIAYPSGYLESVEPSRLPPFTIASGDIRTTALRLYVRTHVLHSRVHV
jgi:hypothetical protein